MNSLVILVLVLIAFLLAQRFYSRFLYHKVFTLDDHFRTPAHSLQDGVDYVPSKSPVLFGHHFASIAGLAPILGPAVAVIWGWLPALLWVVFGSIFFGAVHDFAALVLSVKQGGRSIGDISRPLIGPRGRVLLLLLIFFAVALAMGVFAFVISGLLVKYPQVVLPAVTMMVVALAMGYLMYKRGFHILPLTVVSLMIMAFSIFLGQKFPISTIPFTEIVFTDKIWTYSLLVYAFIASVLPVWILLQPRDYLNSFQLYGSMMLLMASIFVSAPVIVAPAIHRSAEGVPLLFPFLFITVACGAISGFHSVVSSGTTAKQLNKMSDARSVAFGGMLTEGLLAVLAVLACTAGFATRDAWMATYSSWGTMSKLNLPTFVDCAANLLSSLGIPHQLGATFISLAVVGFALTTLDSGTRLLRYNVEEICTAKFTKFRVNRYLAAFLAVFAIGNIALLRIEGKPVGLILWQLFGSTNQLLAGLGLLVATVYLFIHKKKILYTLIPMIFMIITTTVALILNIGEFYSGGQTGLVILGSCILLLSLWLIIEAFVVCQRERGKKRM